MNALTLPAEPALVVTIANALFGRTTTRIVEMHDGRVLIVTDEGTGVALSAAEVVAKAQTAMALAEVDRRLATAAVSLRTLAPATETVVHSAREEADAARKAREVEDLRHAAKPDRPLIQLGDTDIPEFMPGVEFEGCDPQGALRRRARFERIAQEVPDVR